MSQNEFDALWQDIHTELAEINRTVSISEPESDIARFNALSSSESMAISDLTAELLTIAKEIHEESNGAFDPTIYPLADLWGFTPRFSEGTWKKIMPYDRDYDKNGKMPIPEDVWVQALLPLVDFNGIELSGSKGNYQLKKLTADVSFEGYTFTAQLDLGGIAKGYAADQVYQILKKHKVQDAVFSCGDSSLYILHNDQNKTDLNLKKPRRDDTKESSFGSISCGTAGVSTSNDASLALVYDGIVYSHILNPETGYPVNTPHDSISDGCLSATLLMDSAVTADAVTTALSAMSRDDALAYLNSHYSNAQYVLVYRTDEVNFSIETNCDAFTVTDTSYQLSSYK